MITFCRIEVTYRDKVLSGASAVLSYERDNWTKAMSFGVKLTEEEKKVLYALYERLNKEYPPVP